MAFPATYHADSDADDEYERSLLTSPQMPTDDDTSPTDSGPPSAEHTPTTFDYPDGDRLSPRTIVSEWTADECANFVSSLGLQQYCDTFIGTHSSEGRAGNDANGSVLKENEIVGEALVALQHDELKEMGIVSMGHRLTILKGVYDVKIKQDISVESDHYIPLCTEGFTLSHLLRC